MSFVRLSSINRNIVECKADLLPLNPDIGDVLIETLWNVKDFKEKVMEMVQSVLIETLWNVKREKYLI